ncbi:YrhK family protein [Phycicoccus sp. BSK3Z-2]|uniref:YrhK family protein n=1 Tax=Phycicoccus avicenniae TaxID=2828860 RepID=A0A941D5E9_9MICO|nr:YrhK family protein [Phycicoccus avicenniae]MBR7742449.1 YrhK family protein [Phycicoccus avicenniae]
MDLQLPGAREELVIRDRYETVSIVNDLLVAIWFLVGSILFFSADTTYAGTWLFVVGSAQLMLRPSIRLSRRVHLKRHHRRHGRTGPVETSQDF